MAEKQITFRFADIDVDTREAFQRYCDVRQAEARASSESEHTKQLAEENRHREADAARRREEVADEPQIIVERARAEAEARKIRRATEFEDAKQEIELQKERREADAADMQSRVSVFEKVLEVVWPKIESIGYGFVGMVREENQETRDLLVANMHLLAGRNPKDGAK